MERLTLLTAQTQLSATVQRNSASCSSEITLVAKTCIQLWLLLFQSTKSNQRALGEVIFSLRMLTSSISEDKKQYARTSRQSSKEIKWLQTRSQCTSLQAVNSTMWTKSHSFGSKIHLGAGLISQTVDNGLALHPKMLF